MLMATANSATKVLRDARQPVAEEEDVFMGLKRIRQAV